MKTLALALPVALFSVSIALGQTNKVAQANPTNPPPAVPATTGFSVARTNAVARAPERKIQYSGAIVKARRTGKPLQMINPFAPAAYGEGSDSVAIDPTTGRAAGIALFRIEF